MSLRLFPQSKKLMKKVNILGMELERQRQAQEISKVGQVLERYLSEQGITIPFPNYEELLIKIEEAEERKKNYQSFKNKLSPEDRKKYNIAFGEKD